MGRSAWAQSIQIQSENICTECSVLVKSMIDGRGVLGPNPAPRQARVALALFHHPHLRYLENVAINQIAQRVGQTRLGQSLMQASRQSQAISYRLFYQVGVDDRGMTSLNNEQGVSTYLLDRKDPHEMWGFFQSQNQNGLIFINEYQHPWNAQYTMIHEMFHLLDEKTGQYTRSRENQEWTGLDDLVLEFRAQLAEVLFRQQQLAAHSQGGWRELTGQKDFHDQFLRGSEIQVEKISQMVVDLMYPLKAVSAKELAFDSEAPIFEIMNKRKTAWSIPTEILQEGILDAVSWFMGESLQRCADDCSSLHVALLSYRPSLPESAIRWAQEKRMDLQRELQSRGARSFFEYLKTQGMFDDLSSGLKLRSAGLNLYGAKSGGPSPRLGGGTRLSRDQSDGLSSKRRSEAEDFGQNLASSTRSKERKELDERSRRRENSFEDLNSGDRSRKQEERKDPYERF